jgi:hypothetical protein
LEVVREGEPVQKKITARCHYNSRVRVRRRGKSPPGTW